MSWLDFLRDNKAIPRRQSADITDMERTAGKVIPKMVKTESKETNTLREYLHFGLLNRIAVF